MSIFNKAKKEIEEIESEVQSWYCNGKEYKIPVINGDYESQKEFIDVADKYDARVAGKPSDIVKVLREFMYKMLKMKNDITEDEAGKIASVKRCQEVYAIWLEQSE